MEVDSVMPRKLSFSKVKEFLQEAKGFLIPELLVFLLESLSGSLIIYIHWP